MIRALIAMGVVVGLGGVAQAHRTWANGEPIPKGIQDKCCGVAEAHHLDDEDVQGLSDGYHIRGLSTVIPYDKAMPSPDGSPWIFYRNGEGSNPIVHCFFYGMKGV